MKKKKINCCVYCKCENELILTRDHIVPKSLGGTDDPKNIQTTCWICNQLKGSLTHEQALKYFKALKILKELKKIKMNFPSNIPISFHAEYHPNYHLLEQNKVQK